MFGILGLSCGAYMHACVRACIHVLRIVLRMCITLRTTRVSFCTWKVGHFVL